MRTFMKKFGVAGWLLFFAVALMGAKVGEDTTRLGDSKTGADIILDMGGGQLKWDDATGKMQFSNDAGASVKEIGSGGGAAGVNLLENADFESGTPPTNWTASGGAFISNTGTPGFDLQSGSFDASATSQTLDSDLKAVPLGLENRSCNATIQVKYASGSVGDYKLQAIANTAGLLAEIDLPVSTDWSKHAVQFICPSSDSIRVRVISTVDGGIILVDNATIGKSDFVNISQTLLVAHANYPLAASCTWTTTSASFADLATVAACDPIVVNFSTFAVDTSDNNLPDIDFDELPEGTYLVEVSLLTNNTTTNISHGVRISDGTTAGVQCSQQSPSAGANEHQRQVCSMTFTYNASGARNFKIQAFTAGGTFQMTNAGDLGTMVWKVWKLPGSSAEAFTTETTGVLIKAEIGGANATLSTGTVNFPGNQVANGGLDMIVHKGSQFNVRIPCAAAEAAGGLTCTADEQLGISFDAPFNGDYEICAKAHVQINGLNSGETVNQGWFLNRTADLDTGGILEQGIRSSMIRASNSNASDIVIAGDIDICEVFTLSAGQNVFRLYYEQGIAGTIAAPLVISDRQTGGEFDEKVVSFQIMAVTQQLPIPVFPGAEDLVKTPGSNTKLVSASIEDLATTPAVTQELGSWIDTITDTGVGQVSLNHSDVFNGGLPNCGCTTTETATSGSSCMITAVTTSAIAIRIRDLAAAFADNTFFVWCHGTR